MTELTRIVRFFCAVAGGMAPLAAARGDYLYWQVDSGAFALRSGTVSRSRELPVAVAPVHGGPLAKTAVLARLGAADRAAYLEILNYDDAVRRRVPADYQRMPYAELVMGSAIADSIVPVDLPQGWHGVGATAPLPETEAAVPRVCADRRSGRKEGGKEDRRQ